MHATQVTGRALTRLGGFASRLDCTYVRSFRLT